VRADGKQRSLKKKGNTNKQEVEKNKTKKQKKFQRYKQGEIV
jgi:hypothetical protein